MILYKFRNFEKQSRERTLEIIRDKELYFSGVEGFNDPFDGKVHLRYDGSINEIKMAQARVQYAMRLRKDKRYEGISMEAALDLINDRIDEEYIKNFAKGRTKRMQDIHNNKGVLSLSTKNNNILMWSHYTHNHKGVCFGFEWDKSDSSIFSNYKKVRYQTHYEDIWSWLHTDQEIADKIFFTKAIDWQYEDEYRIIRGDIGKETFEPSTLKEVIFGSSMKKENIDFIIEECKKNDLNPKYFKAELDIMKYQINIVDYL